MEKDQVVVGQAYRMKVNYQALPQGTIVKVTSISREHGRVRAETAILVAKQDDIDQGIADLPQYVVDANALEPA